MTWDAYELAAAVLHAPMLLPIAMAPAVLWVQWAWVRRPRRGLALTGLAISVAWSLILSYLWQPGWGPQAAWGHWAPLLASRGGVAALALGLSAIAWRWAVFQRQPSRRGHLILQSAWSGLWYFAFVLGGR